MQERTELSITIVHSLPGRLRCRLSANPKNWQAMRSAIASHEGIHLLTYTNATRSILVEHDPELISPEELIIRLAVVMADEHEALLADGVTRVGNCHRERGSEGVRRLAERDSVLAFVG